MTAVSPEILKQVKGIELRTRGLVSAALRRRVPLGVPGQGMEFAEVRAYEPGDDFRTIDWNVSARLGEPVRQDVHRGARAHADAGRGPVGLDAVRRPDQQGGRSRWKSRRCWRWRRRTRTTGSARCSSPTRSSTWCRRGRAGGTRSGCIRDLLAFAPAGDEDQPRRQPDLRRPAAAASQHRRRSSPISSPTDWERPLRRLAARHEVVAVTVDDPRERDAAGRRACCGWRMRRSGQRVLVDTARATDARTRSRGTRSGGGWSGRGLITRPGVDQVALVAGQDYAPVAAAGVRGAGAPAAPRMIAAAPGPAAAGRADGGRHDLARAHVAVPSGSAVRPAPWNPTGDVETLGPPRVTDARRLGGDRVSRWWCGCRDRARSTCRVRCCCSPAAGWTRLPPERMTVTVASVLPAGVPDSLLQIQPAAQPVVRGERTLRSLLVLLLLALLLLVPVHLLWRRRGKPLPRAPARSGDPALPLERWADAGEVRVVLAAATSSLRDAIARAVPEATPAVDVPQVLAAVRAARPDWPLDEIADVLGALEEARFTPEAFPDAAGLATLGPDPRRATRQGGRVSFARPLLLLLLLAPAALVVAAPQATGHRRVQRRGRWSAADARPPWWTRLPPVLRSVALDRVDRRRGRPAGGRQHGRGEAGGDRDRDRDRHLQQHAGRGLRAVQPAGGGEAAGHRVRARAHGRPDRARGVRRARR